MLTLLTILGIMNGVKQAQQGNKVGGIMSALGSMYNAGWLGSATPAGNANALGDFGARRNQF